MMKQLFALMVATTVLIASNHADAARERLTVPSPVLEMGATFAQPATPDPVSSAPTEYEYIVHSQPVEIYQNVRYKQTRKAHPCAEPKIVQVPNPCYDPCDPCCGPKCVNVKICVPPCDCPCISVRRNGDRVRYDYGKYAVDVIVRRNYVLVDYDW